ncbi:MAG: hypothetical protein LBH53_01175 [Puniceicoccales bacterium]|nr:hypothetical protein [Puniceicoccales bacterium]
MLGTVRSVLSADFPQLRPFIENAPSRLDGIDAEEIAPPDGIAPKKTGASALLLAGRARSRRAQLAQSATNYDFPFVEESLREIQNHPDVIDEEEQRQLNGDVELLKSVQTEEGELAAIADRLRELLRKNGRAYHYGWRKEDRGGRKSLLRSIQALLLFAEARKMGNVELDRRLHFLGSGDKAKIYSYRGQKGGRMAFKELPKSNWREDGWDAVANLAVGALCDLLATRGAPPLVVRAIPAVVNGKVGLAMPIVPGKNLRRHPNNSAFWKSPSFRRQEIWLQILDCIGGETDRYVRNVFWDEATETLTAIDSDTSFPLSHRCPTIRWDPVTKEGRPQRYCIPPVIDTDIWTVIEGLSEEELRECLQEIGFFGEQIDAACARLKALKSHKFCVITPDQWANDELLREGGCTDTNCCFLLHLEQSKAMKKGLSPRNGEGFLTGTWPSS